MSTDSDRVAKATLYSLTVDDASEQAVYLLIHQLSRAYIAERALPVIEDGQLAVPRHLSLYAFGRSLGDSSSHERFVNVLYDFVESYSRRGLLFGRTVLHIVYASSPPQEPFVQDWLPAFNMMFSAVEATPQLKTAYQSAFEAAQKDDENIEVAWLNFEDVFRDSNLGRLLQKRLTGRMFKKSITKYVRGKTLSGFDKRVDRMLDEDLFKILGPVI